MEADAFKTFRLVGGTSLSLQIGHRISVDIDLFTDAAYDSIDFNAADKYLRSNFEYVDTSDYRPVGIGTAYYIGNSKDECIKLDIYYTDSFIRPAIEIAEIRMATIEEIIAMKVDVISRSGRKKDFWDIHELSDDFSIDEMIALHKERYPYSHNEQEIRASFINFVNADDDFEPICLSGKYWELIKLDIVNWAGK